MNLSRIPLNKLPSIIMVIATYLALALPLRYWCTDEIRWGLKTLTGRVITLVRVKTVALIQWSCDAFWIDWVRNKSLPRGAYVESI